MPFLTKQYYINQPQKAFLWLMQELNCSQKEAQKILDKQRLVQNSLPIHKSEIISGKVSLTHFFPSFIDILKVLQTPDFVIYDKPHKLLTHPKGIYPHPSLCDTLKAEFGSCANPAHRLDYETSGLILCSINKNHEATLKLLFEHNKIKKTYLARVRGKICKSQLIDIPILPPQKYCKSKNLSIRSKISVLGKVAKTFIAPLQYDLQSNTTLLQVKPLTGRTHQIRLHLSYIGHSILGDPLYGSEDRHCEMYLDENLTSSQRERFFGSSFLHLWAYSLEFDFLDKHYMVTSPLSSHFIRDNLVLPL